MNVDANTQQELGAAASATSIGHSLNAATNQATWATPRAAASTSLALTAPKDLPAVHAKKPPSPASPKKASLAKSGPKAPLLPSKHTRVSAAADKTRPAGHQVSAKPQGIAASFPISTATSQAEPLHSRGMKDKTSQKASPKKPLQKASATAQPSASVSEDAATGADGTETS